jgi:hypothetical protein
MKQLTAEHRHIKPSATAQSRCNSLEFALFMTLSYNIPLAQALTGNDF